MACVFGIGGGAAQQCFEEHGRSRIRIDPPGLVLEPHQHPDVADQKFTRIPVDWPALLRLRIRQIEDGLIDSPVGRSPGDGIRDEIASDPDLSSPGCGQMRNDKGDQHESPEHDD
jgi:hypothetical protein